MIGVFFEGLTCLSAVPDSLVFDVCDVHNVFDEVSTVFQPTPHEVSACEAAEVSYVGVSVDSGSTDIHGYFRWVDGYEWAFLPGHSVVYLYRWVCHGFTSIESTRGLALFLVKSFDTIVSIFPSSREWMGFIQYKGFVIF